MNYLASLTNTSAETWNPTTASPVAMTGLSGKMNAMSAIYVATDIESNGPSPGHHSMLSFGSVAFTPNNTMVESFTRNLDVLPGASEYPPTIAWWRTQPDAWRTCRENAVPPKNAMIDYAAWLKKLPGDPVFVANPVAFDYAFISWYFWEFVGEDPFQRRSLDLSSFAAAMMRCQVTDAKLANMPADWIDQGFQLNHQALDDAIGYAKLASKMLAANQEDHGS